MAGEQKKTRQSKTARHRRRASQAAEPLKIWPEKLLGAKYVRLLEKQLRTLQEEPAHGNQELFFDDVFVIYLLAFFNPTIRSLWTIEVRRAAIPSMKTSSCR